MKLTSPAFENGGEIPAKYTCDGDDIITPLNISDVPANAKSLALVMDDPDAMKPAGKVWDHWVLWNLAPDTKEIKESQAPKAVYGNTSWNRTNWGGPCPPDAEHTYQFKLYALNTMLDLPEGSTKQQLEAAMKGHIVAEALLTGRYNRPRG